MPKKITNPLRSGLPSKIYLAAYGKPISGYEIARRAYGTALALGGRALIPPTAKVYGWLKKLEKDGLVKRLDEGYLSQAAPLINEIEKVLEVHSAKGLSVLEKKILLRILDSKEFRSYVDQKTSKVDLREDVDAARELTELLVAQPFVLKGIETEIENPEILRLPEPATVEEFNRLWGRDIVAVFEEKIKKAYEKIKPALERGSAAKAAFYQAKKTELSLMNDLERIKSRAKDPEGLLALKFACVPAALSEEIVYLSPLAVGAKRVIDNLLKMLRKRAPAKSAA
jgi:hypothetical protein